MAGISNLYAEIGFKVNESGLQEFTKRLASLKKEIDGIAQSLSGIQALKINISTPKIKTEFEKLANQNIRTQLAVRRENRLERAFQYRQQQDKERKEEKREKDRERNQKRFERNFNKTTDNFVKGFLAAAALSAVALRAGFGVIGKSASGSMSYKNYELLTGDAISNIQSWRALAAATGAGNANQIMGQIVGLKQNWANIVRNEGNVNDLKLLGIKAYQNPTEMGQAILKTIQGGNVDPSVIATSLRNLGLDDAGWFRMARATTSQIEMAQRLKELMPTDGQIESLNELYRDFSSLNDVIVSLKDKFATAFLEVDPNLIKELLNILSSEETQRAIKATAIALDGLASAITTTAGVLYNSASWIAEKITDLTTKKYKKGMDWISKNAGTGGIKGNLANVLLFTPFGPELLGSFLDDGTQGSEEQLNRYGSKIRKLETAESLRNIDRIAVGGFGGSMRENQFNDNKTVNNYVTVGSIGEAQEFVSGKSTFSNAFGDVMIMPTNSGG